MNRRSGRRPTRYSSSAIWTPKSISGLQLWLRADLGITIGTGVSAWADQSGTGDANKNVTQAVAGLQPAYSTANAGLNNQPALSFTGSQLLQSGVWASALPQPLTIMVVGRLTTAGKYVCDSINGAVQCGMFDSANTLQVYAGVQRPTLLTSDGTKFVIIAYFNGNASNHYPMAYTSDNYGGIGPGTNGLTGVTVGCYAGGGAFSGSDIAEMAYWNRALTPMEAKSLLNYAGARYALTIGP